MNNNNKNNKNIIKLIESNIFENDIKINNNGIISNSEIEPLKEPEQVALHALLELSLEAAKSELKAEERVNMSTTSFVNKMNTLKTFIRGQTTGIVNNRPRNNNGFAPLTPRR